VIVLLTVPIDIDEKEQDDEHSETDEFDWCSISDSEEDYALNEEDQPNKKPRYDIELNVADFSQQEERRESRSSFSSQRKLIVDKAKKIDTVVQLRKLNDHMMSMGWLRRIEFRERARVPIINLHHGLEIECDIGMGVAAEDTTAQVTYMKSCYASQFKIISFFLKMLLRCYDLDKPFTGGIGSYKLYVMISYIFRRVQSTLSKKSYEYAEVTFDSTKDPDSEFLLLTFLKFFKSSTNLNAGTTIVVPTDGSIAPPTASFEGAFKIDRCCHLFEIIHDFLTDEVGSSINNSVLSKVLCNTDIIKERSISYELCSGKSEGLKKSWVLRCEEDKAHVAKLIFDIMCKKIGQVQYVSFEELKTLRPHFLSILRSYRSVEDFSKFFDAKDKKRSIADIEPQRARNKFGSQNADIAPYHARNKFGLLMNKATQMGAASDAIDRDILRYLGKRKRKDTERLKKRNKKKSG
jgi:hypothetical protein